MSSPERSARGALRGALNQLNGRELLKPEDLPMQVLFWRVVLEPYEARYEGTIETPEMVKQAEDIACSVGRILQLGSMAFKSRTTAGLSLADEPKLPKVGDYVQHNLYAGELVKLKGGKRVRILNDTEILTVLKDPEAIRGYL